MYPPLRVLRRTIPATVAALLLVACAAEDAGRSQRALEGEGGCFRAHIEEAIALNKERLPLYAAITDGASTPVSWGLIASEMLTLVAADRFDEEARPWEQHGVGVLCELFVSMDGVRPFGEAVPPPVADFEARNGVGLAFRLGWSYAWFGSERLSRDVEAELEKLADPRSHCMERHMLESIRRAAHLEPRHVAEAEHLGLASPRGLIGKVIATHIAALPVATGLDALAAPVQAAGVPILCADVPPIEVPAD